MIYKLIRRYIERLFQELDVDVELKDSILSIVVRIGKNVVFHKNIDLNFPNL